MKNAIGFNIVLFMDKYYLLKPLKLAEPTELT
jgi:hypothetical protein